MVLKKAGAYSVIVVLFFMFLGTTAVAFQAPQENEGAGKEQSMKSSAPAMSTAELIQRMKDLNAEISRSIEKMKKGGSGTITLSRDQMAFMCENMQSIIGNMIRLITDLDRMASKDEPLTNEAYRAYAQRMLESMKTCVKHAEALWEGQ